jgi:hypothetical protein
MEIPNTDKVPGIEASGKERHESGSGLRIKVDGVPIYILATENFQSLVDWIGHSRQAACVSSPSSCGFSARKY